jgi:ADP-ribosyl-[dinitrogen reductase] hydrolase
MPGAHHETDKSSATAKAEPRQWLTDRSVGCLLGLAVGDALGSTLEFTKRDTKPLHTEMTGGGPYELKPGEWTDDTAMALALGESLVACGGFNPREVMDRFVAWWRDGVGSCTGTCFDIGIITSKALASYMGNGDPYAGPTSFRSAGNGSLMRLAPAVLHGLSDAERIPALACEQSRLTHGAAEAVEACAFFSVLLSEAIFGASKAEVLAPRRWEDVASIANIAAGSALGKDRDAVRSSAYVVDTLEAAIWSVSQTETFEDALILAVNLGDDADSVGAVTGQLAGALYGTSAIPERWLAPLAWRERITRLAEALPFSAQSDSHW